MTPDPLDRIRAIRDIPALIAYLRDELDWPIGAEDFDELTFEYEPEELGIDARTAARIEEIKQLRPLAAGQPWGVFFIRFEPKRLPVVVLRRILSQLVVRKRASAKKSDLATWNLHDLLFISNYGEGADRQITFAHFTQDAASGDLPTLKVLGWDDADTALHISHVHHELQEKLRWPEDEKDLDGWRERWSSAFTLRHRQVITTSKDLAGRLAALARLIRRRADQVLNVETERGPLRRLHKAFREALIHDLSEEDFADMYAQTIAYGLLAARLSRPMGIIAENVADMVPVTNPFLRDMLGTFLTIGGRKGKIDFDELGIQDVVDLLNSPDTRMEAIVRDFGNRTRQEDPVIHFYELFLAEYDKKMKVKRGVFYTPQPVVSYIVRSVHELLQTEFGLADGLADTTTWGEMAKRNPAIKIPEGVSQEEPFVQILDIATGTATFLVEVIDIIHKTMTAKWRREGRLELEFDSLWNEYVPKRLLPRLYGYELLMAPYAIAHMKIGLKLYETGYRFGSNERVHVYLTNALEPPQDFSDRLAFDAPALANEARAVNAVKRDKRFTVVIGNPPYANFGQLNRIPFILNLLEDYKRGLDEKKLNLDDDFIKFLRLGQYCISQAQSGVLGMITNNTFIDGATRRCMRASMAESFDAIRIVDLHGNSIEREKSPDGSVDQNVFDIQQGVAISLFSKIRSSANKRCECLAHADVFGLQSDKYGHLGSRSVANMKFIDCDITPPLFRFQPVLAKGQAEYLSYSALDTVFSISGSGVKTDRDALCFDHDRIELAARMRTAFEGSFGKDFANTFKIKDSSSYDLTRRLRTRAFDPKVITRCLYRLFDVKWLYYQPGFTSRPAWDVMQHLLDNNIALLAKRQARDGDYNWFFVVKGLVVDGLFSIDNKGREQAFPLYLQPYKKAAQGMFMEGQRLNIGDEFINAFADRLGRRRVRPWSLPEGVTPEAFLNYVYAVFHSPGYRTRYSQFLKIDFPRLPLTSSLELFRELARLGGEIVALHLVEAPVQTGISIRHDKIGGWTYAYATPPSVRVAFTGPAEPVVDKVGWSDDTVWIDAVKPKKGATEAIVTGTIGFRGVSEEVWNFHIGGYQVCEKWLKDRKGRTLDADDLIHYHRIVVALHETIRLMAEIDRVIAAHGGWPGAFI